MSAPVQNHECEHCGRSFDNAQGLGVHKSRSHELVFDDEAWLREKYVDEGMNTYEIADEVGVSPTTIRRYLSKHGVEKRTRAGNPKDALWRDPDWLEEKYVHEERSAPDVAELAGCSAATIRRELSKAGIEGRSPGYYNRQTHATFYTDPHGYEMWQSGTYSDGEETFRYVRVHRLACVAWHGFDALNEMHVHHRNGTPWDNREDNLELLTNSEHQTLHNEIEHGDGDYVEI